MENKHNIITITSFALAISALIVAIFGGSQNITLNPNTKEHTISVQAESERLVAPDTAQVSYQMTRKSTDLSQATESVNTRIGEMVSALTEYGVKEEDMKTTSYQVQPEYNYLRSSGERVFDGYRVRQTIELVIRDLNQVSPILTEVSNFEVDNVSGLSFYLDDDEELRAELRAEAIKKAKKKAKKLAADLGVELDTIVNFSEQDGNIPSPRPVYEMARGAGDAVASKAVVPSGENTYTSQVNISYLLEN
jgi:uncharacterized protein YggE